MYPLAVKLVEQLNYEDLDLDCLGDHLMNIVSQFQEVAELVKKVASREIKAELLQKLIDVQQTAFNLQQENAELREKIKAMNDAEAQKEQYHYANNAYWRLDEIPPHPYCTACFDDKGKAIRLTITTAASRCPVCQALYKVSVKTAQ